MSRESRILVTGGLGLVGSALAGRLVEAGHEVVVLDDGSSALPGNRNGIPGTHLQRGDLSRPGDLETLPEGPWAAVYHLAAQADVPRSVREPMVDFRANALGTMNLLEWCRARQVDRFVYASTVAVYDPGVSKPIREDALLSPSSPYGASKLAGEALVTAYHRTYGLSTCVLRLFNVYGPGMTKYVIHDLIRKLQKDPHRLEILGTGEQVRDYVYVGDAVAGFMAAAERGEPGAVMNLGSGQGIRITDLADEIIQAMGLGGVSKAFTGSSWAGDIDAWYADASRLQALGWAPATSLEEGLAATVASLVKSGSETGS
jgi:UDP-glucose 4-epimerase